MGKFNKSPEWYARSRIMDQKSEINILNYKIEQLQQDIQWLLQNCELSTKHLTDDFKEEAEEIHSRIVKEHNKPQGGGK